MGNDTLFLIGNAHLDPVWLWRRAEGYAEIKATFQSALDRMDEFGDYVFTSACAAYYQWVEENEPELFEKIRARVREGRWAIAGGMWVQPDCNLPSGESFARHLLYSQRYFQEKFGQIATVGYNVDSFGHNGMLPQLLRQAGIDAYVFERPCQDENAALPHLFLWESPDGSRVTAFKILFNYSDAWWGYEDDEETKGMSTFRAKAVVTKRIAAGQGVPFMGFYGVGNHGGGPTKACLTELEGLRRDDPQVRYASPAEYFAAVRELRLDLPVVTGDLQHHAIGCYSAYSPIKRKNRRTENRLVSAEKYDVLAAELTGAASRAGKIQAGWKRLLFNQFHDILAGCCIKSALEEAERYSEAAWAEGDEAASCALQRIAWHIDTARGIAARPTGKEDWILWETEGEGAPVVIFNPHAFPVRTPVVLNHGGIAAIRDAEGRGYPLQKVRGEQSNGSDTQNTLFLAELPPLGYQTYYLSRKGEAVQPAGESCTADGTRLENACLLVEFDPAAGGISLLRDKRTGLDIMTGGGAAGLIIEDESSDTWAHGKNVLDGVIGRFGDAAIETVESGPLSAALRVTTRYGGSTLTQVFRLYADKAAVYVDCRIDYHEDHKILKLAFPVNASCGQAAYEIPFGFLEKPCTGMEEPGQRYASLGGGAVHLAVLNDGKYSFSAKENELRMIAARSCGYADHFSDRAVPVELMEQGVQEFRYVLLPHGGDLAEAAREAMLLNQPVEPVYGTNHGGELPASFCGLEVDSPSVVCETVKYAEDGEALILRLYETAGRPAQAEVAVHIPHYESRFSLSFGKQEIRTVRLSRGGEAHPADLLERPVKLKEERA